MSTHSLLSGLDLHEPYHFVQETDPGAVGSGKYWLKVSTGTVKRRNDANSGWNTVSAGTTTFIGLSDVPSSYTGQGGKGVRVKADVTGLEFFDAASNPTTTKGDIIARTTSALARLAVGADGLVLTADAAEVTGMKWAAAAGGGGITFVTPPAASASTGTQGSLAIDATWFYICKATNDWVKIAHRGVDTTFIYISVGDANGIFYWLGTQGLVSAWVNPDTGGFMNMVTSTPDGGANPNLMVDRAASNFNTTSVANSFIGFDLGSGKSLKCSGYTLQNRGSFASESIRNWKLQGTNSVSANTEAGFNAASWTDLDTQTANTTISSGAQWGYFAVTPTTFYRYFRILQTGLNSTSTNHLCLGEFEFYGTLGP